MDLFQFITIIITIQQNINNKFFRDEVVESTE